MRAVAVAVTVACSACTHLLEPTVTLSPAREAPLPMRAALVMDERFRERVDEYGKFGTLGFAHSWNVATGAGLTPALLSAAKSVFADVRVVQPPDQPRGVEVALYPDVKAMRPVEDRSGFWFELVLRVQVMGASGGVLFDRTYREQAEGSSAAAFFGGVAAATPALLVPTEEVMRRALEKFRDELRPAMAAARAPIPPPVAAASAVAPPPPPPPAASPGDAAPPPPPPPVAATSSGDACVPACRRGYLCHLGACISACNPPCAAGEQCTEQGQCIASIAPQPMFIQPPRDPEPPEPEKPSSLAVYVNLADAALFGLTAGVDVHIGGKFGVVVEGRAANLGAMSYFSTFPFGPGKASGFGQAYSLTFGSGFGGTVGIQKFFSSHPGVRGFYLGVAAELLQRQYALNPNFSGWRMGTVSEWYVVPHGRLGYRWRWGGFLFALGVRGGAGVLVSSSYTSNDGDAVGWATSRQTFIDVGAVLDMGFYLL